MKRQSLIARFVRVGLMIGLSSCSGPRWPMWAYCRRRGHVRSVAVIQLRSRSCAVGRLPSRPALAPARAGGRRAVLPVTSGARSLSWMSSGACLQADPDLFFPVAVTGQAARQAEAAKAVCGPCAVRKNCLSFALEAMPEGIWGGTTPDERRAARRRPSRYQARSPSRGLVSAPVTGGNATHAAGEPGLPGRAA